MYELKDEKITKKNEKMKKKKKKRNKIMPGVAQAPIETTPELFVCEIMEGKCLFMLTFDMELNNAQL